MRCLLVVVQAVVEEIERAQAQAGQQVTRPHSLPTLAPYDNNNNDENNIIINNSNNNNNNSDRVRVT